MHQKRHSPFNNEIIQMIRNNGKRVRITRCRVENLLDRRLGRLIVPVAAHIHASGRNATSDSRKIITAAFPSTASTPHPHALPYSRETFCNCLLCDTLFNLYRGIYS